jgi:hypothetical protein
MKRILCSLLVAILSFGSVLADPPKSKSAKVTLVYSTSCRTFPARRRSGKTVIRVRP